MTDDRALKRAIRQRMQLTGEKYTEARRAMAAGSRRTAGLADACLADLNAEEFDAWDREATATVLSWTNDQSPAGTAAALSEARMLHAASQPSVHYMISVPAGAPGVDLERDATFAASIAFSRRTVAVQQPAGTSVRLTELNSRLFDRICELIGAWPEPQWSDAVTRRVNDLAKARRSGRARGQRLREEGQLPDPAPPTPAGWIVRHPRDHYFRRARPALTDGVLRLVADDWIAELAPSYDTLVAADWAPDEARADFVADVEFGGEIPAWTTPAPADVVGTHHGPAHVGERVLVLQVPDADGPFNGTLMAILPHERWRVCGSLQPSGAVLPADGTRRLNAQ